MLISLTDLMAQHRQGKLSELAFLVRAVTLLSGSDPLAVLAASTAPNGGWLGEPKHAYEQALEAAGRSVTGMLASALLSPSWSVTVLVCDSNSTWTESADAIRCDAGKAGRLPMPNLVDRNE